MDPKSEIPQEQINNKVDDSGLLERLNSFCAPYHSGRFKKLPEVSAEARQTLSQVRVAVVDDMADLLLLTGSDLFVVTGECVSLVHHTTQSAQGLIDEIVAARPDVILMDGALKNGVKGAALIPAILQSLPLCCVIAHSGGGEVNDQMLQAGAFDKIGKSEHSSSISRVAQIYEQFTRERFPVFDSPRIASDLTDQQLRSPVTPKDLEILMAFSMLLQGFLLSEATPQQRAEMGVPDGLLDDDELADSSEVSRNSQWWLEPFAGINLATYSTPALEKCPGLRALLAKLLAGPRVELSWQEANRTNDEILLVLEGSNP